MTPTGARPAPLTVALDLAQRLHARGSLAGALSEAAADLGPFLGATRTVVLRVFDWQADGVLVQPWADPQGGDADCIDLDALVLARAQELPLGQALAGLVTSYGPTYIDQPSRPWRPREVMQVLVLPVRLGLRAVAALEFHDPAAPDDVARQLLELVGLQLTQAAQREEALRTQWVHAEQYGRLAMLASRTARGAVITDVEGVIEWAHPAFAETTGHSTAEVRGRPLWEVLVRDVDDVRPALLLRERFRSGEAFRIEFMARRGAVCLAPAEAYWVEVDADLVADETSGRLQYVCLCRDITERRQQQHGLDEGREILAALTDNLPISLVALDARDLQVISLNRHAELEFGAADEAVAGRALTQALGPGLAELISPQVRQALGRRMPVEHEFVWESADGRRVVAARHVAVGGGGAAGPGGGAGAGAGVGAGAGAPRIVISQLRDVTQMRRAEQTLRESEQRYRELVESIDEGVFVIDPADGCYHYLSPRVHDMLGIDEFADELPPGPQLPHVLAEDQALLAAQGLRERRGEPSDVMLRIRHPLHGLRWLRRRTRTRPLPDGRLRVYGLLGDVTQEREQALQLQAARDTAEAASQAKGRFLATMSHEIRTPMNGILGMTELLLGTVLNDRQRRFAQAVYRSGENLLEILNDVLDFAKIEAGRLELQPGRFGLRSVVEDTLELLAPRAHAKQLELSYRHGEDVPVQVDADALRLRQVLTNLIGNAIKFTDHGEVAVTLEVAGAEEYGDEGAAPPAGAQLLACTVRDTGMGIAAQELPRLFSAFTQVHDGMARRHGGTGLGLAISQQLVQLMGGAFTVRSTPGEGSSFRFTFLVHAAPPDDGPTAARPPGLLAWRGRRALVVDDHPGGRQAVAALLSEVGMQVDLADGGQAALARLGDIAPGEPAYDLAVLDWHMPQLDGPGLGRVLREHPRLAALPWLLMTSTDADDAPPEAADGGCRGLLHKPVRQAELHAALELLRPGAPPPGPLQPRIDARVLVVEDNAVNQEVMAQMLRRCGATVQVSRCAVDGLQALAQETFDLVLMDIQMPDMDGIEALGRLRSGAGVPAPRCTAAQVPVIAVTANALPGDEARLIGLGFDGYLSKPYRLDQLLDVLRRVLPVRGAAPGASAPQDSMDPPVPPVSRAENGDGIPLLDPAALERLRQLDPDGQNHLVERVMAAFDASVERFVPQFVQARAGLDVAALRHVVHTLKSSCASTGALTLAELCAQCDRNLREGRPLDQLGGLLDQVQAELLRVQGGLRQMRATARSLAPA
ncbi:hypothetical protein CATMQ487_37330 [Sphaerotilus microaerophilus]|uniref:histidine kinase n=1 Tax=Sphaerotilus microaerophilus TaxID=2914710 RepID=A0ABM7YQD6_9BURK|nr:hypothetical protein CATMQ487_37330 [Sphaerotilus sp. FB-5]